MTWCARFALLFAAPFAVAIDAVAGPESWTTIKNERHGFAIAYPASIFEQKAPPRTDEGRLFISKDGKAKLLVGAFTNDWDASLKDYRQFLLSEQYAGADIDYAPVKRSWFVLSGEQAGQIFYQRVTFTCQGKLINSWAMLYPAAERKIYDRLVEAVARTFTPGEGRTGACD